MTTSRREFLRLAAIMATLPHLPLAGQDREKKRRLKKGYMLNSFPPAKGLSILDKFKLLKAAGFEGVEPNSHQDRAELLAAREATGLNIASISCGGHSRLLAHPSAAQRQKGVEGLLYAVETAGVLGAKSILIVAGGVNESVTYTANYERTQTELRRVLPRAEKLGVTLAIENVWNNFLFSPLEAARYVDEFKSPAVGWHFDCGNVMSVGWPEHWIRILGQRIKAIHLKEFSREKMKKEGLRQGFNVAYRQGDNNWPAILQALDDIGYAGWAICEPACRPCKEQLPVDEYLARVSDDWERIMDAKREG